MTRLAGSDLQFSKYHNELYGRVLCTVLQLLLVVVAVNVKCNLNYCSMYFNYHHTVYSSMY